MSVTRTKTNTWKLTVTRESFIQVLKKKKKKGDWKEVWEKTNKTSKEQKKKITNLLCNKILFLTSIFYR